jgi:preprotein translocase subunit SecD
VAAEDLETEVLFPEARRLRRRRWTIGVAVVTAALIVVALVFAGASLSSAKTRPAGTKERYALSATSVGTARLYFRPVDCIIAPYSGGRSSASGPAISTSEAGRLCKSSPLQQVRYPTTTAPGNDSPNAAVVLPLYAGPQSGRYVLGPAQMSGSIVKTAQADLNSFTNQWEVIVNFTAVGSAEFNGDAAQYYLCYKKDTSNPPYCGALQAIDLDGTVLSTPAIESSHFAGSAEISGTLSDPFTKAQAMEIAAQVRAASKMAPISG